LSGRGRYGRRDENRSFRHTFSPEGLWPFSYRPFRLWGREGDDNCGCREEKGAKRRAKKGTLRFMEKRKLALKHLPVDLVGYDVDLIPEKASVQCRRFDPATGKKFTFC
jgi:hypothetical protein